MFGAIYGDIIGSYYEIHCTKDFNFPLENSSTFTDDSVLIASECKAILNHPDDIGRFGARKEPLNLRLNTDRIIPIFRMGKGFFGI